MKPGSLLRASFAWEPTLLREPGGVPPCQGWACGAGKEGDTRPGDTRPGAPRKRGKSVKQATGLSLMETGKGR